MMRDLADIRESIQDDIITCVDSFLLETPYRSFCPVSPDDANELKTMLCQIVVDHFNKGK